jgi:hypothetical protein
MYEGARSRHSCNSLSSSKTASRYRLRCPLPFETPNNLSVTELLILINFASSIAGASCGIWPSGMGRMPVSSIYSSSMYAGSDTSESCNLKEGGRPRELNQLHPRSRYLAAFKSSPTVRIKTRFRISLSKGLKLVQLASLRCKPNSNATAEIIRLRCQRWPIL